MTTTTVSPAAQKVLEAVAALAATPSDLKMSAGEFTAAAKELIRAKLAKVNSQGLLTQTTKGACYIVRLHSK